MRLLVPGYHIGLYRIRPGHEPDAEARLLEAGVLCFRALGTFDLVAFRPLGLLDERFDLILPSDLLGWWDIRCFQSDLDPEPLIDWLAAQPCLTLTLAKLRPHKGTVVQLSDEMETVESVVGGYASRVLHTLGWHELAVLGGGRDLGALLGEVTDLRQTLSSNLSATITIPLFSTADTLLAQCEGDLSCVVGVRSRPAAEATVADYWSSRGELSNVYGDRDVLVRRDGVSAEQLMGEISDFRKQFADSGLVDTSTEVVSPLAQGASSPPIATESLLSAAAEALADELAAIPCTDVETANAAVSMGSTLAVLSRDFGLGSLGVEQVASFQLLLEEIQAEDPGAVPGRRVGFRIRLLRALRNLELSLVQRSGQSDDSSITGSGLLGPFSLTGADARLAAAAAACPFELLLALKEDGRPTVPRFNVVFGGSYSPAYLDGTISYPQTVCYRPGEEWWRIGHEVAHAWYGLSDFKNLHRATFEDLEDHMRECLGDFMTVYPLHFDTWMEELYAQWFDYNICFQRNRDLYLRAIWTAWIKVPRVWDRGTEYLLRSLCMFCYDCLEEWDATATDETRYISWLEGKFQEMTELVRGTVPGFNELLKNARHHVNQILTLAAVYGLPTLAFFSSQEVQLRALFEPPKMAAILSQVDILADGGLLETMQDIPQTLVEVYRRTADGAWCGTADAALVLSLWNYVNVVEGSIASSLDDYKE
ncbi:MAG: hypothetical protein Q8K99_11275 [Actinomycetota bacterium]|nr:hypothetical protein [Actinomycetota bacterium]